MVLMSETSKYTVLLMSETSQDCNDSKVNKTLNKILLKRAKSSTIDTTI